METPTISRKTSTAQAQPMAIFFPIYAPFFASMTSVADSEVGPPDCRLRPVACGALESDGFASWATLP